MAPILASSFCLQLADPRRHAALTTELNAEVAELAAAADAELAAEVAELAPDLAAGLSEVAAELAEVAALEFQFFGRQLPRGAGEAGDRLLAALPPAALLDAVTDHGDSARLRR